MHHKPNFYPNNLLEPVHETVQETFQEMTSDQNWNVTEETPILPPSVDEADGIEAVEISEND